MDHIEREINRCIDDIDDPDSPNSPQDIIGDTAGRIIALGGGHDQLMKLQNLLIHRTHVPKEDIEAWIKASRNFFADVVHPRPVISYEQPRQPRHSDSGAVGQRLDGLLGHNGPPSPDLTIRDAADDPDPHEMEPREWMLGNHFCKQFISGLMAEGGTGKTSLRIAQLMSSASGRALTGHHVFRRSRVLIISLEDSRQELQKRIAAARLHHGIQKEELRGWLYYITLEEIKGLKLALAGPGGQLLKGPLEAALRKIIGDLKIDIVSIDPTIKAHELDENINKQMDFVADIISMMAIDLNIAADLSMHTKKGQKQAGDSDNGRGASSMRDAGRLIYTLMTMSPDEASAFSIEPNERHRYIRLDRAKVNLTTKAGNADWFKLVGVPLGNGTAVYPAGDEVQTVEAWSPPETWTGLSDVALNAALDEIEDGLPNGQRFSDAPKAEVRGAWAIVQRHCPNKTEQQCREIVRTWVRNGVLTKEDYTDPVTRKESKGLRVNQAKRPGTTQ